MIKSYWPNHESAEINIEFDEQKIVLFSDRLYADIDLPYQIDEKKGKAQFIKDDKILEISLPIKD